MEVKYDWWNNQPLRISFTNFSSIPQYFTLKYRFENNINAEWSVSKIGIKLTSRNNSRCGDGTRYFDGDVKHIQVKPTDETLLKIYPRKLGLTATTASPMVDYGRGHSFFLKMAMVAEF